MNLLIVESPHKAETISNFLKGDFRVVATKGHIKNLPKHDLGVEKKEDKYFGDWQLDKEKTKLLSEIKELAKESQKIYIATDDDREGERIGWDVVEYLKLKTYYRIIFHEISKNAVEIAINEARLIDKNIINAQMARRIIDRIVGYPVSDTIRWHFIKNKIVPYDTAKKLGIGRVTAPALKLIIENEKKIENFEPKHYKKIAIDYYHDGIFFRVKNKLKFDPQTQDKEMSAFLAILNNPANKHVVEQYKRDIKEISPPPPLTTTWMQRAANYLFSFKPDYTMKIAQELYENGLITYMRTDSHHISEEKIHEIYNVVFNTFGEEYLLTEKRYKDDEKAHESIRPVYFSEEYYPKKLKFKLSKDQYKLYRFIFLRTLAVFMKPALYDRSSITVSIEGNKFIAYSNVLEFEGWEKIGKIWRKAESDDIDEEIILPKTLNAGDILDPIEVSLYDYETRRPPRFGVGRFLTTLEQLGIARPSTIATILPNLEKKSFIKIMNNFIIPENLGKKTIDFLDEYAQWLTDTANAKLFEEALDMIERGELEKDDLIKGYEKLKDEFQESVGFEEKKKQGNTKEYLGKCIACKSGLIYETEKTFRCNNYSCNFTLFKSSFTLLEKNGRYIPEVNHKDYIKALLESPRKRIYFEGLKSSKGKEFNAYLTIKRVDKGDKTYWNFAFSFPKKDVSKNTLTEEQILTSETYNKVNKDGKVKF